MKFLLPGLLVGLAFAAVSCGKSSSAKALPYPLATCIVSDEKLGSMGAPYVFVHEGREIKLCCKGCLKDFEAEPKRFLAKLAAPAPAPAPAAK
jgi:hypothetical protein